ncbi:unnamed protein product [Discula destructiva]
MLLSLASTRGPTKWFILFTVAWFTLALFYNRPYLIPFNGEARINALISGSSEPSHAPLEEDENIPPMQRLGNEAFREVCDTTDWNDSLVFTCYESFGGIGNIRNSFLHCIRYAMQAGASLVLPRPVLRSDSDIGHLQTGQIGDFSYMFDISHFLASMRTLCPQMRIYISVDEAWGWLDREAEGLTLTLTPEELVEGGVPRTGLPDPGAWRGQFYSWLDEQLATAEKEKGGPPARIVVNLRRSYMTYPIYSDGEPFALAFASILRFRVDMRRLAKKILEALLERFSLDVDVNQDILPNAFFGVHLRTEADALKVWGSDDYWFYGHYENQVNAYLKQVPRSNSKAIYVASGDLNELNRFAADVAKSDPPHNLPVVHKADLLSGEDLKALKALTFDQQAVVDYEVLLKASDFAGVAHSSFAWSIALKRHQFAQKEGTYLDAPEMLDDDLSKIYGTVKDFEDYPKVLWPRRT